MNEEEACPLYARQSAISKASNFKTTWPNFLQTLNLYGAIEPVSTAPFWVLLTLLAGFHFATMQIYPPPFVDEGWFGSRAWSFHLTHRAFGPLDRGVFDHFPGYWTYFPWLPCFLQSLMFAGSQHPALMPMRVWSVLFGLLLLIALHSIFRRLAGARAALLGILVISLSPVFMLSSHMARYDVIVAAFGFSAVALSLTSNSIRANFVSGILSAAAFEAHPYGCFYAPICILVYFIYDRRNAMKSRKLWGFIAGTMCGLAGYYLFHIARYPETWFAINRIAGSHTHMPPLFSGSLVEIGKSIAGAIRLTFSMSPFLISTALFSGVYLCFRKDKRDRPLLLLALVFAIVPGLILKNQFGYYAILYAPILEFTGVYLLFRARHLALRLIILTMLIGSLVYGSTLPLRDNQLASYQQVNSRLNSVIKPGEVVMGSQTWWFGLYEHPWYSWEELFYFRQFKSGASLEDAFKELRPQILIIDAHLSYFIRDYPPTDESYFAQLSLPATELNTILKKYSTVRAEFNANYYGKIQVIEFHWDR